MYIKRVIHSVIFLLSIITLTACGGGDIGSNGDDGDNGDNSDTPSLPVAPQVITISPSKDSKTSLVTTIVMAQFDRDMDKSNTEGNFSLIDESDNSISGTAEYTSSDNILKFTPKKDLVSGMTYTGIFTTAVTDSSSEPLAEEYRWSFTVAPTPTLVSTDNEGKVGTFYGSDESAISATGEYIVFVSKENLTGYNTDDNAHIYRKNTVTGKIEIVSLSDNGELANEDCFSPRVSDTGRYVVFASYADNLDLDYIGTANSHIYLRDMKSHTTTLLDVSTTDSTQPANGSSRSPDISGIPDDESQGAGKYIVFESTADDLHDKDSDSVSDIYLMNLGSDSIELISISTDEIKGDAGSHAPRVSNNGRRVVFESDAENLAGTDTFTLSNNIDTNKVRDVFLRSLGTDPASAADDDTTRLSVDANGDEVFGGTEGSRNADISADGLYIVFQSDQPTLAGNINNNKADIFIRETADPSTIMTLSLAEGDTDGADGDSTQPSISANGRYISFKSEATDLVDIDTNDVADIFVRDRNSTTISLISSDNTSIQAIYPGHHPAISSDGRYVSFTTTSSLDSIHDINEWNDIYRAHNIEVR